MLLDAHFHGILQTFTKSREVHISFSKFLSNQKGNAIVMVLLGTIGVVAVSYLTVQRAKINNSINIKSKADKDVEDVAMKVGSYFLSPANCNANFYNKTLTGTLTPGSSVLSVCNGGNCINTGSAATTVANGAIPILAPNSTSWQASQTGISDRVRIVGLTWSISQAQKLLSMSGGIKAAVLRVNVTFQKNLGFVNGARKTVNIVRPFEAFVVSSVFNNVTQPVYPYLVDGPNIHGCAWSPNSTNVYQ
ncbi:MAG: hypothetical protein K2Q18_12370 [Bdellovibrionales bacterium]|nr:hypothetical protein [Bdellovibrionales bacterium]